MHLRKRYDSWRREVGFVQVGAGVRARSEESRKQTSVVEVCMADNRELLWKRKHRKNTNSIDACWNIYVIFNT